MNLELYDQITQLLEDQIIQEDVKRLNQQTHIFFKKNNSTYKLFHVSIPLI